MGKKMLDVNIHWKHGESGMLVGQQWHTVDVVHSSYIPKQIKRHRHTKNQQWHTTHNRRVAYCQPLLICVSLQNLKPYLNTLFVNSYQNKACNREPGFWCHVRASLCYTSFCNFDFSFSISLISLSEKNEASSTAPNIRNWNLNKVKWLFCEQRKKVQLPWQFTGSGARVLRLL